MSKSASVCTTIRKLFFISFYNVLNQAMVQRELEGDVAFPTKIWFGV